MPKYVDQEAVADALCCTARTVRNLENQRVIARREDGTYDLQGVLLAYIRHRAADVEGRQARAEDARMQTQHRRLKIQRELGHLITTDEMSALGDEIWAAVLQTWNLCASHMYHAGAAALGDQWRVIAGGIDGVAKAELHVLREKLRQRFAGVAVGLTDESRIEALMASLAGEVEA